LRHTGSGRRDCRDCRDEGDADQYLICRQICSAHDGVLDKLCLIGRCYKRIHQFMVARWL
jgi:hypothetical protein